MPLSSPPTSSDSFAQLRPTLPGRWARFRLAFGQEQFGRPAGPWATLFTPLALAGVMIALANAFALPPQVWPWLSHRLGEIAWLLWAPLAIATLGQAIARVVSNHTWRETEGEEHLDYSPRAWHYYASCALAALPLLLLQACPPFLDLYLGVGLRLESVFGHLDSAHVGYDPDWSNLIVLGVLPLVGWQTRRVLEGIPCGRLVGLQRELARLRSAVAWEPDAWTGLVADTFDRWMEDIQPPLTPEPPAAERQRKQRVRWGALRREVVISFQQSPPDLLRANRALAIFRQSA